MAIQARPEKANEISGLMITGVAGGAIAPPLMGSVPMLSADKVVQLLLSLFVLLTCYSVLMELK